MTRRLAARGAVWLTFSAVLIFGGLHLPAVTLPFGVIDPGVVARSWWRLGVLCAGLLLLGLRYVRATQTPPAAPAPEPSQEIQPS